jgi:Kef-type K+ transport system membrane component KefB
MNGVETPLTVPLALLLVFVSAKLLAELFERLHLPAIVGEILAGILLGPQALGWLSPNAILDVLSQLGVIFLLFRTGLEVKSSALLDSGLMGLGVAVGGVVVPFASGWGIARLMGEPHMESVFIGAAMVATSVGITAQVLSSRRLLDAPASRVILAAAVIDDVLGLIVLAIVSSMAKGSVNIPSLVITGLVAAGFTCLIALWGSRAAGRLYPRVQSRLRVADAEFTISLSVLFALSVLAVYAGVAAIIGAFLAGMALSETVEQRVHTMTHGVTELFTPFFLVGIGLRFTFDTLTNPATLSLCLAITAAAIASKFIGAGAAAARMGARDAVRVGVGMIPRGEVGVVVAQIGLAMGVMENRVYGIVVFMSLATTLAAPPLLHLAFRRAGTLD